MESKYPLTEVPEAPSMTNVSTINNALDPKLRSLIYRISVLEKTPIKMIRPTKRYC
jgi:hypothetical protein